MVQIKARHLTVSVNVDGIKRVLGTWIEQTEGARFWMQVMTKMNQPYLPMFIAWSTYEISDASFTSLRVLVGARSCDSPRSVVAGPAQAQHVQR